MGSNHFMGMQWLRQDKPLAVNMNYARAWIAKQRPCPREGFEVGGTPPKIRGVRGRQGGGGLRRHESYSNGWGALVWSSLQHQSGEYDFAV